MRIAIYLGNNVGSTVDARNIENGNPGVGGAHYCLLMLAHYLNKINKYKVGIITVRDYIVADGIDIIKVTQDEEVINEAIQWNTDVLILKQFPNSPLRSLIQKSDLKVIVWSHNFLSSDFCRYITETPQIKCNVFVGKQQYDSYIDNDVISKSIVIYNMVTSDNTKIHRINDGRSVVFMGAICQKKGFLEMCRIWPGILKDIPNARLIVLGSGKLYGDKQLGPYGIADERYEKQFIPFMIDKNGRLLPSIEFKGVVSHEKSDYFCNASVGIVNPSGSRETFGMGIVEMGRSGLPVVTIGTTGYYDTIINHETGILEKSQEKLQKSIVNLLKNRDLNHKLGGRSHALK